MGIHHHQDATFRIRRQCQKTLLAFRVGIGHDEPVWVLEGERGIGEPDAVTREVQPGLRRIPTLVVHGKCMYACAQRQMPRDAKLDPARVA